MTKSSKVAQADGKHGGTYHRFLKRHKNRIERRRAKADPETTPGYGRYSGWES